MDGGEEEVGERTHDVITKKNFVLDVEIYFWL